jgi:diacylglycerol kinase (ATP)
MKAQLIYNPVAGQRDVNSELRQAIAFLEAQGWQVTLRRTLGPGDATTYAREAVADHCDLAVAVGGDGTLGEVANGLVGSDCGLGVLPVGTGNVWAHMLGLPVWSPSNRNALVDAARVLVEGQSHYIDLGKIGDRHFVLWTGIGLDAEVAQGVEPHRDIRRNLGNFTYWVTTIALTLGMRGTRATVVIDDKAVRQRAFLILVTNAQLYAASWCVAPQAQLDDGMLDVYIFKGRSIIDVLRHVIMIALGKHRQDPQVETFRGRRIEIRGEKSLPLHVDGEPHGHTPVTISVVPRSLRVVVPAWASTSLFEGGTSSVERRNTLA